MKKLASSLAGTMLLTGALTACGGGGDEYCDDLRAAQDQFESLGDGDFEQFDEALDTLQTLGDEAPDEVAGDWEVLTAGLSDFQTALDDAGVSMEELSDPEALASLDPDVMQNLNDVASSMTGADFEEASESIKTHATEECDVELGGG